MTLKMVSPSPDEVPFKGSEITVVQHNEIPAESFDFLMTLCSLEEKI